EQYRSAAADSASESAERERVESVLPLPQPDPHAGSAVQPADGLARIAAGPVPAVLGAGRIWPLLRVGTIQLARIEGAESLQPRVQRSFRLCVYSREERDLFQRSGHLHGSPDVATERSAAPPGYGSQHVRAALRPRPRLPEQHSAGGRFCSWRLEGDWSN